MTTIPFLRRRDSEPKEATMSSNSMPIQQPVMAPPMQAEGTLDALWRSHLEAQTQADAATRHKAEALDRAQKARQRHDHLRGQIEALQQQAAEVWAEALRAEVAAEEATKAEQQYGPVAKELGALVEFAVSFHRLEHPASRILPQGGPPTGPGEQTLAFRAAREAAQP